MLLKKTTAIKKTLPISLGILLVFALSTCKKYPENTLWSLSPEGAFKGGYITAYTVDGADSIPMWNTIYNTSPYNGFTPPSPVGLLYDFKTFLWKVPHEKTLTSEIGYGEFHFYANKKYIYIYFKMDLFYTSSPWNNPPPQYNIFYTAEGNWKILKLTKSGTLRIQRIYNNKVYEIQFN